MRARSVRSIARRALRYTGTAVRTRREAGRFELELRHRWLPGPRPDARPPRLFRDPLEALRHVHGGKPAAFACPLDTCVDSNGLSFGRRGWHPFVATLRDYAAGAVAHYEGSWLQRYYREYQPANLAEALLGRAHFDAPALHEIPSHVLNLYPWSARSSDEARETIERNIHRDYVEHGRPDLTVGNDGCQFHGPVSDDAGRLQFDRLVQAYENVRQEGYRREHGDCRVIPVRREGRLRFIVVDGLHRTAAMQAVGRRAVPATFTQAPTIFDVADANHWPQVTRGPWTRAAAERYIDRLFDFDAAAWA